MPTLSGLVGAVVEAWGELRVHRLRILLSLIGVAVAVAALTSVVGIGAMVQQAMTETWERQSGRPATLYASVYSNEGLPVDTVKAVAAFEQVVDRYSIDWAGSVINSGIGVQFLDGMSFVGLTAIDPDFGTMHRVQLTDGQWFTDADGRRLAPALVVNQKFYERLGSPNLASHPTVTMLGEQKTTAVIIGVYPSSDFEEPNTYILNSAYLQLIPPLETQNTPPQWEFWVPPELADQLSNQIQRDLSGAVGKGFSVEVNRQDYQAWGQEDPLGPMKMLVTGVAILVLLLGALGLVNISMVTVRQRIREIGIRRSFGATSGRVFFAVMLESVVASFVAGVVGVAIAILLVTNPSVQEVVAQGLTDMPPFPMEAAVVGLAAATGVGALAGLLPALVAVRVKVIDAIRY